MKRLDLDSRHITETFTFPKSLTLYTQPFRPKSKHILWASTQPGTCSPHHTSVSCRSRLPGASAQHCMHNLLLGLAQPLLRRGFNFFPILSISRCSLYKIMAFMLEYQVLWSYSSLTLSCPLSLPMVPSSFANSRPSRGLNWHKSRLCKEELNRKLCWKTGTRFSLSSLQVPCRQSLGIIARKYAPPGALAPD